jgi:hypothetical protein
MFEIYNNLPLIERVLVALVVWCAPLGYLAWRSNEEAKHHHDEALKALAEFKSHVSNKGQL